MSATRTRLTDDMKSAMKAGDRELLGVIRMLLNEIKNAEINDLKEPGRIRTETEVIQIIAGYQKQLTKSLAEYPADRQAPLKAELAVVERYLPQPLVGSELEAFVAEFIQQSEDKAFGPLMKKLQSELIGRVDGKSLSETLKKLLG